MPYRASPAAGIQAVGDPQYTNPFHPSITSARRKECCANRFIDRNSRFPPAMECKSDGPGDGPNPRERFPMPVRGGLSPAEPFEFFPLSLKFRVGFPSPEQAPRYPEPHEPGFIVCEPR